MLATAVVCSGNEIATLTEHQQALHTAEQRELLNIGKFGVVEVVDRPQPQQVLPTLWVQKQRHGALHQSPMPSESVPMCVEPALEPQLDSSKVWLCKKALQGLKISLQALSFDVREETHTTIRRFDQLASHG